MELVEPRAKQKAQMTEQITHEQENSPARGATEICISRPEHGLACVAHQHPGENGTRQHDRKEIHQAEKELLRFEIHRLASPAVEPVARSHLQAPTATQPPLPGESRVCATLVALSPQATGLRVSDGNVTYNQMSTKSSRNTISAKLHRGLSVLQIGDGRDTRPVHAAGRPDRPRVKRAAALLTTSMAALHFK